jgi:hypothetical protein
MVASFVGQKVSLNLAGADDGTLANIAESGGASGEGGGGAWLAPPGCCGIIVL